MRSLNCKLLQKSRTRKQNANKNRAASLPPARCFPLLSEAERYAGIHFKPLYAENVAPVAEIPDIFP